MIYDMSTDPKFIAEHNNPQFQSHCFRGQSIGGTLVSVPSKKCKDKQTLLCGFVRLYPAPKAVCSNCPTGYPIYCYNQTGPSSYVDHAVVISRDGGNSWCPEAETIGQGSEFQYAISHLPTTAPTCGYTEIVHDGSLDVPMAVSPKTGRVYMAWQGANNRDYPSICDAQNQPAIFISVSKNEGKCWTDPVIVSRTPFTKNPLLQGNNQSFNPNIVVLDNGLVGVIYTDYRNNEARVNTTHAVRADVWLDIYREVDGPGSTGIGLDYTGEEVQLTSSTNTPPYTIRADYGVNSPIGGIGVTNGIAAYGNSFLTAYSNTHQAPCNPPTSTDFYANVCENNILNIVYAQVTP